MRTTQVTTCESPTCDLVADRGHPTLCVLHDPNYSKDAALFKARLEAKIRKDEDAADAKVIDLTRVVFPPGTDLGAHAFRKEVNFAEAAFASGANFSGAIFGTAGFFRSMFDGTVSFDDAQFDGPALFEEAKFAGDANFWNVEFYHEARFSRARFHRSARFAKTKFGRDADFNGAVFDGLADFAYARFNSIGAFFSAKFAAEVEFATASSASDAYFANTKFEGSTEFHNARFAGEVNFRQADFSSAKYLKFTRVDIDTSLFFHHALFPTAGTGAIVRFHYLTLSTTQRLRFEGVNLSRVSFLRTDVSQVQFVGCTWAQKQYPRLWPLSFSRPGILAHKRNAIYDDLALDYPEEDSAELGQNLHLVADLYRQLRLNLEGSRQEVEAGDFYIGQMEMRRRDPGNWPERRFHMLLLSGYRLLAMYGESYIRPFAWYVIFAFLFAIGYWMVGNVSYPDGFFSALTSGALFREVPKGIVSWEKMLVYFNMLFDILLLGLTVVALRRRFSK